MQVSNAMTASESELAHTESQQETMASFITQVDETPSTRMNFPFW